MVTYSILLALLLPLSQAGTEDLPKDMKLTWSINVDTVNFSIQVPGTSVTNYDWWGIGIKDTKDGMQMVNADIVVVYKASGSIKDFHATQNGRPSLDTEISGTDDLSNEKLEGGSVYIASWTRKLNTGDANDVVLEVGETYYVIYAFGTLDSGVLQKHADTDRGINIFKFTNDYEDDGKDDEDLLEDDDNALYYILATLLLGIYAFI